MYFAIISYILEENIRSDELICQGTRILNWGVRKELLRNVSIFQKLTENIQSDEVECQIAKYERNY